MNDKRTQILLTNDDSIHSPGLWAAAEALDPLGWVHVVAPRDQQSGVGRMREGSPAKAPTRRGCGSCRRARGARSR
ncbi:MAG: 5'/3'-nucleotidase SurE [Chloroflexota bacterium]|nr:5'/3'-nucleotidase SurE [Chloroflexota bacterium]